MAIPKLSVFKEVVIQKRGNLTKVANHFSVDRCTVHAWVKNNPKFKQIVDDARGRLFDDCLVTAEFISLGIPEKDKDGKMIGWKERPDSNMLRYLMSTLGRNEGFSEHQSVDMNIEAHGSISVEDWIKERTKK